MLWVVASPHHFFPNVIEGVACAVSRISGEAMFAPHDSQLIFAARLAFAAVATISTKVVPVSIDTRAIDERLAPYAGCDLSAHHSQTHGN
jgi:hypothetical protein